MTVRPTALKRECSSGEGLSGRHDTGWKRGRRDVGRPTGSAAKQFRGVGRGQRAQRVVDDDLGLSSRNDDGCVADIGALLVLSAQHAVQLVGGLASRLEGDVDAVGGHVVPGHEARLDRAAREPDEDVAERRHEGDGEDGHADPAAHGPTIEAVSLLHRRAELVPGEWCGHVVETIPVTSPLRLMAVHAHPDDESSKGAAAMAKYVSEGVEVLVVTCTGGERGDVLNAAAQADVDERGLLAVRREEMAAAAAVLGVQHAWLGFEDSGYPEGDPLPPLPVGCFAELPLNDTIAPLVALIREFRPQVVTTYDENGGYPHPDHVRTHETTMAAIDAAADPARFPGLGGDPWDVQKVYYNQQFTKARVEALHLAMIDADLDSPYHDWLTNWEDRPDDANVVTTRVVAADWFEDRDRALVQHRTQIDPDSMWFAVPLAFQREVWPTEDFQLARSRVETTVPEDDLFAGLREDAS